MLFIFLIETLVNNLVLYLECYGLSSVSNSKHSTHWKRFLTIDLLYVLRNLQQVNESISSSSSNIYKSLQGSIVNDYSVFEARYPRLTYSSALPNTCMFITFNIVIINVVVLTINTFSVWNIHVDECIGPDRKIKSTSRAVHAKLAARKITENTGF